MVAIFGGKAPHPVAIEAGGVTTGPGVDGIAKYASVLGKAAKFIRNKYLNDLVGGGQGFPGVFNEGRGYGNLLSYPWLPENGGAVLPSPAARPSRAQYAALNLDEDHRGPRVRLLQGQPAERGRQAAGTRP